ncbi:hypothetical protein [Nonomuraea gerenzanensis]|uniref:hypothetical protein n=1 Tax=Nonomuraea gerenzanensis TaxID=93944 RepID=UPI001CD9FEE2|nr:hypothetical protein [Nonomuraea gerenzanensis]UBU10372.1 hypothetical protein LCN96_39420 [Nonomuraea gerenzanensis]
MIHRTLALHGTAMTIIVGATAPAADAPAADAPAADAAAAHAAAITQQARAAAAVTVAKHQLGDPYRYKAAGPAAFDCSGLPASAGDLDPRPARTQTR